MADYATLSALFKGIADSIRAKKGGSGEIVANKFPSEIDSIVTSGQKPEQTKTVTITQNGDTTITPDVGKVLTSVLAKVNVAAGGLPMLHKVIEAPHIESGWYNFVTGEPWLTEHRYDPGLFAVVMPVTPTTTLNHWTLLFGANFSIGMNGGNTAYGLTVCVAKNDSLYVRVNKGQLDGSPTSYSSTLTIGNDNNLGASIGTTTQMEAGTYHVFVVSLPI